MAMQAFFFMKGAILQGSGAKRQSASVRALQLPLVMQKFQIFANGDQGRVKPIRQVANQNAAIALQKLQNSAPAFLVEHGQSVCSSFSQILIQLAATPVF